MVEKAAKLDRDTFGVAVGQGPWQRRLEEMRKSKRVRGVVYLL
jgi:hypothetical protein